MQGKKKRNSDGTQNEVLFFFSEKSKTTQEPDSITGNPLVLAFFFSRLLRVRKRMEKEQIGPSAAH